jgi:hypothetical protein
MSMWRRRVSFALLGLLGALLLLEGLVRLRQYRRYGTTLTTYYELAQDERSGLMIPRPLSVAGPIRVNSLGFRGEEIEVPKPAGRVRVAFLGGSTTFCAEASSLATTWPHQVVEQLRRAAPEVEFDYVNGGAAAYSTEQSLLNLAHRVGPLEPDVIVIYHATNDLVIESRRRALALGLYRLEEHAPSRLGEYWLSYYLLQKNLRHLLRREDDDPGHMPFEPALLDPFRTRLTELVREAQARAKVVALVTFATRLRSDQAPEVQRAAAASSLGYMPFFDTPDLLAGYAEANQVVRAVAAETGAILVEGEDSIPADDAHFADTVHLRDPGLGLQAERVSRALLDSKAFRGLCAERGH